MSKLFILGCAAVLAAKGLFAADLTLIGKHPATSRAIHALKSHGGRIYMGYGDWNVHPFIVIASYDPSSNAFRLEYSAPTDSLDSFRSIGGKLYAPSIDPVHYDGFRDYSVLDAGVWRSFAPAGLVHVFDIGTLTGTDLWLIGAKLPNETPTEGGAVMHSLDGGRSWADVTLGVAPYSDRYFYGFASRPRFFVDGRTYEENGAVAIGTAPSGAIAMVNVVNGGGSEFMVGVGRPPGFPGSSSYPLVTYDGVTRLLSPNVICIAVDKSTIYAVMDSGVWRASSPAATEIIWEKLPLTGIVGVMSVEFLEGILYFGDNQGRLWAGRVDGTPLEQSPAPAVINELSDGFGRSLAASGGALAIGSPDHSGAQYLCGQVTIWEQTASAWALQGTIDPPQPSFAASFGKDVAIADDLMAVLEAGRDLSDSWRGRSAQVHIFQRTPAGWVARQTIDYPFANTIALDAQRLVVAAPKFYESSYLNLSIYKRTENDPVQFVLETNFINTLSYYEPILRIAMDGDILACGLAGDFSRYGGPGQVDIYRRDSQGAWALLTNLRQDSPPLPAGLVQQPDAFGFALSLKGSWLAVGAPRDDTAAAQAGAVHLYERADSESSTNFLLRQTIISPVAQPDAAFGTSVSLSGSNLVVGAPGVDVIQRQRGRVFTFQRQASGQWTEVGEVTPPPGAVGEFGAEVLNTSNLVFAACGTAAPSTNLTDRITIASFPNAFPKADLVVTHNMSPSIISSGVPVNCAMTVTNAGPVMATGVRVVFTATEDFQIESIVSGGFACTHTGLEVECVMDQLPAGSGDSLVIQGHSNYSQGCGFVHAEVTAFAREFEPTPLNNRAAVTASSSAPEVSMIGPAEGTIFRLGEVVPLVAETSATTGIRGVLFYTNDISVAVMATPPSYTFLWTNVPAGVHRVTARLVTECGAYSTSAVRTFSVSTNVFPQTTVLSPASGTRFPNTNSVPIYVSAFDPDGRVTRVDVFRDHSTKIYINVVGPPYFTVWSNAPNGSHVLHAVVTDDRGAASMSVLSRILIGPELGLGTNWVAYNDHGAASGSKVTGYNILGTSSTSTGGPLKNANAINQNAPARLAITRSTNQFSGSAGAIPQIDSPAARTFSGFVNFANGNPANVEIVPPAWVRYTFSGLDPNLRYNFKGSAVRGNPDYADRWTLVELLGARSFESEHTAGCLTQGMGSLDSNQAALNTGINLVGDMVVWRNIQPARDGTFAVNCTQYLGPVPGGSSAGASGYALTGVAIEEANFPVGPPPAISTQPISLTLSPGAPALFSVSAANANGPLTYQWFRNNAVIPGAVANSLAFAAASSNDVGAYNVIITGDVGDIVSDRAILTLLSLNIQTNLLSGERFAGLTVFGPVGQRYSAQFVNAIEPVLPWTALTNFTLSLSPMTLVDPEFTTISNRFYRVLPQP